MDNQLIVSETSHTELAQPAITPATWRMMMEMASVIYRGRIFSVSSPEAAATIMLKGVELGIGFTASFELIQSVQGHVQLSPRGAMALMLNSPKIKAVKIDRLVGKNDDFIGYACTMTRDNGFTYTTRWTMADARRAGLVKPGSGWENYPENMCLWRAVGFCADVVAPDITAGMTGLMKMPEQFNVALSQEGDVIDAAPIPTSEPEKTAPTVSLDALLAQYGAETILEANEGRIPATDDEVAALAAKLGGVA